MLLALVTVVALPRCSSYRVARLARHARCYRGGADRRCVVKKLVTLVLAVGAAAFLRRKRDERPAAEVWREATRTPSSSPPGT